MTQSVLRAPATLYSSSHSWKCRFSLTHCPLCSTHPPTHPMPWWYCTTDPTTQYGCPQVKSSMHSSCSHYYVYTCSTHQLYLVSTAQLTSIPLVSILLQCSNIPLFYYLLRVQPWLHHYHSTSTYSSTSLPHVFVCYPLLYYPHYYPLGVSTVFVTSFIRNSSTSPPHGKERATLYSIWTVLV